MRLCPVSFCCWQKVCGEAFTIDVGNLGLPCLLIILFYTIHKGSKMKPWSNSTFSFPWWRTDPIAMDVDKAKNMRITVAIKSRMMRFFPRTIQSFSRGIASTPNYIYSKSGFLTLPSLVFIIVGLQYQSRKFRILSFRKRTETDVVHHWCTNHQATSMQIHLKYYIYYNNLILIINPECHPDDILFPWSNATYSFLNTNILNSTTLIP